MEQTPERDNEGLPWWAWLLMGVGCCVMLVPVIGIVAAIAIPQFMHSVQKAKQAEAEQVLSQTADRVKTHYQRTESIPGVGLTLKSTGDPPVGGEKVETTPTGLSSEKRKLWKTLGLPTGELMYFQYVYRANASDGRTEVTLEARADFEEGGDVHTVEQKIVVEGGKLRTRVPVTMNEGQ